jgi:hypothetical protein
LATSFLNPKKAIKIHLPEAITSLEEKSGQAENVSKPY